MIEWTTLEQIRTNLEAVLYKNGFSQCEIHSKTNYKYGDKYCMLTALNRDSEKTYLLIEYADSLEEANKNFYEDGEKQAVTKAIRVISENTILYKSNFQWYS
jgi:hypothetical protein